MLCNAFGLLSTYGIGCCLSEEIVVLLCNHEAERKSSRTRETQKEFWTLEEEVTAAHVGKVQSGKAQSGKAQVCR